MSWSVSIPAQPFDSFLKAVEQAQLNDEYNKAELVSQWRDQLEAAKTGVLGILSRDGFSHEPAEWSADFSGHANHAGAGEGTTYTTQEYIRVSINRNPKAGA